VDNLPVAESDGLSRLGGPRGGYIGRENGAIRAVAPPPLNTIDEVRRKASSVEAGLIFPTRPYKRPPR